jgi:hypothetical protein
MYARSTYRLAQVMHNLYNGRAFLLDSVVEHSEETFIVSLVLNIPEPGQLVGVRQRHYIIVDVAQSVLPPDLLKSDSLSSRLQPHQIQHSQYLVTPSSVEDDAIGE